MEADITYNGVKLVVVYDYHKGEEQTWDYPGSAPEAEVESVFAEDSETDLIDLFTGIQIEEIEETILELKKDY